MVGLTLGANLPSGCNFQDVSGNIVCTWAWYAAPQVCMLALPSVLKREAAQGFGVSQWNAHAEGSVEHSAERCRSANSFARFS